MLLNLQQTIKGRVYFLTFADAERILSNVSGGGGMVIDPHEQLKSITGEDAKELVVISFQFCILVPSLVRTFVQQARLVRGEKSR